MTKEVQPKVTIFRSLFGSKDVPFYLEIDKALIRIKNGKSKDIVDKIRAEPVKDKRDNLKKQLPAVLFAGEFSERNKNGCKSHSGFMITDFDNFPNPEEYDRVFKILTENPHIYSVFMSPSGKKGLKAVVRIPQCNAQDHYRYFTQFNKEFQIPYWDASNSDISRVCFESYDPDIYINKNAVVFNPILKDEGSYIKDYFSYTPLTDENEIINRIMQWDWKKSFQEGQRNSFIFDLAGTFCEFGIREESAYGYLVNEVARGDLSGFTESELKNTIKSAYRKRDANSRIFEDYEKKKQLKKDIIHKSKDYILEKYENVKEDDYKDLKEKNEDTVFWYYAEDSKGNQKLKIDYLKYKHYLERNGFKKYFHSGSQKPTLVKVISNKVAETSAEKIKDFVLNDLLMKANNDVWSYCANYPNLFSDNFLIILETINLEMLTDTKDKSFIAFNNGILEITKDSVELREYIDVDSYIWENQIIPYDFSFSANIENEYKQFITNISGGATPSFESVIGYLCSTYKNKMNNKAVILNDEVISENPEGGTGKGLFVQGLRQVRRVSILDGKTFDDKKSFPYQTVTPETQILVFDDVKKNWDFESKFSLVTEGMTLERKNKDAIKLTVEESPKILVSTNYAIKGEGNSHDRRRFELEVAQYYGRELSPLDEFGHQLFDDWDLNHFNRFYNYIVKCVQLYLKEGLIKQDAKNIKLRKLIAETSMEFYEWISESENFQIEERYETKVLFAYFVNDYVDYQKSLTRKRFAIWMAKYAHFLNLYYNTFNTNGLRLCEISKIKL